MRPAPKPQRLPTLAKAVRVAAQVPGQFPMQTAPTCNTTQGLDIFNNIRIQYQDSLKRAGALDRVGSGAFMPACIDHTLAWYGNIFTNDAW